VTHLKRWPLKLLAEKVESTEQSNRCLELGFDLFQGYYYARPVILSGKRTDSSRLALMKLIGLVQGDAETTEIEQVFKRDPSLSFNLLRMVNSVAMGMRYKIASLKQAIVVLGYQQLHRWLQLLLFVNQGGNLQNPLLELAATRGRLMELLAAVQVPHDKDFKERAFMVGIMSLLDTMFGMPLQEIVKQVNLSEDVEDALLNQGGKLGKLLLLVQKMEQTDFDAAAELLTDMRLTQSALIQAQIEAMVWVNDIKEIADD
jgi:EAL and modified HD-GYP domain-containing signal transduction protein